jgi:hypothetical protein
MTKIFAAIASLATATMLIGGAATPVFASTGPAYRLVPVTAVTSNKSVVVNETLWRCTTDGCVAAQSTSRPSIVCAQAARKVGKLESFTANGTAFSAEELAKCNEKAKS